MLTIDEIRHRAEAMERLAATVSEADAPAFRHVAMQWRLLGVEAVFMDAMCPSGALEPDPSDRPAPSSQKAGDPGQPSRRNR